MALVGERVLRRSRRRGARGARGRTVGALPGELPGARRARSHDERGADRRRRGPRARFRVGGSRDGRPRWRAPSPGSGVRRSMSQRSEASRRRRPAVGTPPRSMAATLLGAPYLQSALVTLGVIARHVRDRVHVGTASRRSTPASSKRRPKRCTEIAAAGFVHVPAHTRLPGRRGAVLHVRRARARGGKLEQWGADQARGEDAPPRACGIITHHHAVGRMHRPW